MALKMGKCPRCGGHVTVELEGIISEDCTVNGKPGRTARAARFYACNFCEWCEEITKGRH